MLGFRHLFLTIAVLLLVSCTEEIVPAEYQPKTDREAYQLKLRHAGLDQTALGLAWSEAADRSMSNPIVSDLPFEESFYFSDKLPEAYTYQMTAKRGQKIMIDLVRIGAPQNLGSSQLFMDLFRVDADLEGGMVQVASSNRDKNRLAFEPRRDGLYLLRIQPELLIGGRFKMRVEMGPALDFPVAGGDNRDIGSFFGDPRDGGRRKHHGIDIFARRHTPIIAPCDGYIRYVGERGLGGKVVWMRDTQRDMTLYFAHLHEIIAKDDTWVSTGDTLGTVGNTGNARTTPPHLHFGIYQDGPIDPLQFVRRMKKKVAPVRGDPILLGTIARSRRRTKLYREGLLVREIEANQWLEIEAIRKNLCRTRLADGEWGYLAISDLEIAADPISHSQLPDSSAIRSHILPQADLIQEVSSKDGLQVLAKHDHHLFVQTKNGITGWIEAAP